MFQLILRIVKKPSRICVGRSVGPAPVEVKPGGKWNQNSCAQNFEKPGRTFKPSGRPRARKAAGGLIFKG